jgi:hypothetical protein
MFVVASDDGRVTIEVPAAALATDPGITITALGSDNIPDDLTDLGSDPWVYALEPGQLEFDAPVRVTMAIPYEEFAVSGIGEGVPLTSIVITSDDGWQFVDDLYIARDGDAVLVSGSIDHFSRLAAIDEQVLVDTRFIDLTADRTMQLGVDFRWSNGVTLAPPTLEASFAPFDPDVGAVAAVFADGGLSLACPTDVTTAAGDLDITALLQSVSDSSGQTGLTAAPRITTLQDQETTITFSAGLELLCRPTITEDGSITLDLYVDHPRGAVIVPGEDFRGGLSALYIDLGFGLPPLYVGLIRDVDGDGRIGPNDVMYPPFPTDVVDGASTVVLPLFGFGDYFPYFLADEPRGLDTQMLVSDGATILLGGVRPEKTAVPLLGDIPFLAHVFSDESRQTENAELVIFITPRLAQSDED